MPLIDGYGVLSGTLDNYACDSGRDPAEYYHCHLYIQANARRYRCAIDLDTRRQEDRLHWRIVRTDGSALQNVSRLEPGWHNLPSEPGSGALDYLRSPELRPTRERVAASGTGMNGLFSQLDSPWVYGSSQHALQELEPLLLSARRLFVFGEPFRVGLGVHNIHQNQGDPPNSRWSRENGIWQDGAVALLGHDGNAAFFMVRFKHQAFFTDAEGHPA